MLLSIVLAASVNAQLPTQFCKGLSPGTYCSLQQDRMVISCPASTGVFCQVGEVCQDALTSDGNGNATCISNSQLPEVKICAKSNGRFSTCLNDQQVVECPDSRVYSCPSDLVCQKRGLRGYCVPKQYQKTPDVNGCSSQKETICDPLNQKRVVSCPLNAGFICGSGRMCMPLNSTSVGCVNVEDNLVAFCSNKPLYSSYCTADSELVMCGTTPTKYSCPSGQPHCSQQLGITALCK